MPLLLYLAASCANVSGLSQFYCRATRARPRAFRNSTAVPIGDSIGRSIAKRGGDIHARFVPRYRRPDVGQTRPRQVLQRVKGRRDCLGRSLAHFPSRGLCRRVNYDENARNPRRVESRILARRIVGAFPAYLAARKPEITADTSATPRITRATRHR